VPASLYVHVGRRHARRDREQAETEDHRRIDVAHVDFSDCSVGLAFFDAEFDVQAFALVDASNSILRSIRKAIV